MLPERLVDLITKLILALCVTKFLLRRKNMKVECKWLEFWLWMIVVFITLAVTGVI